jgi:chromosome segregation protein
VDRSRILSRGRRKKELEEMLPEKISHLEKLRLRLESLQAQSAKKSKEIQEKSQALEKMDREIFEIRRRADSNRAQKEQAAREQAGLEKGLKALDSVIEEHDAGLKSISLEIEKAREELSEKKDAIERVREENSSQLEKLGRLSQAREGLGQEAAALESREGLISSEAEADRRLLQENSTDLESLRARKAEKETALAQERSLLQETQNKKSILGLRLKSLQVALNSTRQALGQMEGQRSALEEETAGHGKRQGEIQERINEIRISRIESGSRLSYLQERLEEFPEEIKNVPIKKGTTRQEAQGEAENARKRLAAFENVNFSAREEYEENKKRFDFLNGQLEDLKESVRSLREIIREMDEASVAALEQTMELVNGHFGRLFKKVFQGGKGSVYFTDPENKLESGVEVEVQPPGKRACSINQLSTGEKSLTAVTLLFAILSIKPAPFIILDELDAPLDEANVEKIASLIREFSLKSQFVVITHNRKTMEFADKLVGVTMEEPGVSKVVSVRFEDVEKFTGEKKAVTIS